jgi:hypothetical protein
MARSRVVLAAGKAVREQRDRANFALRAIKQGGQCLALGIAKIEPFCGHEHLLAGIALRWRSRRPWRLMGGYRLQQTVTVVRSKLKNAVIHGRRGCAQAEDKNHEPS